MSSFQFKQFTIRQDKTAMKVGTDGVLLGAWADISRASRILDIGTGTGLIAIMAAQRNTSASIEAVEIEEDAFLQAKENIISCPWSNRIEVYHTSIPDYHTHELFDSIVCNPPFFIRSTKAPDQQRSTARHCDSLSHSELLQSSQRLLQENGNLSVILPCEEGKIFIRLAPDFGLFPSRITEVFPTLQSVKPKRLLIELSRKAQERVTNTLTIEHARHVYDPQYTQLTRDFYLYL